MLRDRSTGSNRLVSVNLAGTGAGNGASSQPILSADGRHVAFLSRATDLVPQPTLERLNVFVRDLAANTKRLVSLARTALTGGDGDCESVTLSSNGSWVVFASAARNLTAHPDDNQLNDVFARHLAGNSNVLVSVNRLGTATGNQASLSPVISANGRWVVFTSDSSDLVAQDDNEAPDVFMRDLVAGTTALVSVNLAGTGSGAGASQGGAVSAKSSFPMADGAFPGRRPGHD